MRRTQVAVLTGCLLMAGGAGAGTASADQPADRPGEPRLVEPSQRRPGAIPHLILRGPEPVPIPEVRPRGPEPVPELRREGPARKRLPPEVRSSVVGRAQ